MRMRVLRETIMEPNDLGQVVREEAGYVERFPEFGQRRHCSECGNKVI